MHSERIRRRDGSNEYGTRENKMQARLRRQVSGVARADDDELRRSVKKTKLKKLRRTERRPFTKLPHNESKILVVERDSIRLNRQAC